MSHSANDLASPPATAPCLEGRGAPARAAYIHVPFCRRRCGYCNFTLIAARRDLFEPYVTAVERELQSLGQPHEVDTLFLGGGTPTELPAELLKRLLETAQRWLPLAANHELSVEANPEDVREPLAAMLAELGVTRLSLGAQSFQRRKLAVLERSHHAECIASAAAVARRWMRSVSLDLIFGVPQESFSEWDRDLSAALAIAPHHLSTYGLTYEKGAAFYSRRDRGLLAPVDEEVERDMYVAAVDRITAAGFEHYEVSNFALPGHRCRHNEAYWRGASYLAFGPGAARHVGGRRETNHRSTTTYIRRVLAGQSPTAEAEELAPPQSARERLVFGLRRMEGVDRTRFQVETGYDLGELAGAAIRRFVDAGLLEWSGDRLRLTREGLLVSDSLWPDLL